MDVVVSRSSGNFVDIPLSLCISVAGYFDSVPGRLRGARLAFVAAEQNSVAKCR